jgi:carboxypeptidase T
MVPPEIALRLMEYLLNNYGVDDDVSWLLNDHLIVIVPVANPDGRRLAEQGLMQRKNMNTSYGGGCANPPTATNQYGVDLNRNFNFKWGTVNTPSEPKCGQTYPGPSAASEPESLALQNLKAMLFADQRGPLDTDAAPQTTTGVFIDLHSTGNLVMWAWAHNNTVPPNGSDLELIGRRLAAYNGHTPQQAIQLYPSSGSTRDYAYGELGLASFTFEIGPGSGACGGFMPPFNCLDTGADLRREDCTRAIPVEQRADARISFGHNPNAQSAHLLFARTVQRAIQRRAKHHCGGNLS